MAAAQQRLARAEEARASMRERYGEAQAKALHNQARIDEVRRTLSELESHQESIDDELSKASEAVAVAEAEVLGAAVAEQSALSAEEKG